MVLLSSPVIARVHSMNADWAPVGRQPSDQANRQQSTVGDECRERLERHVNADDNNFTTIALWLGSRVVSVLDSGAEGPGFKSQPRCCRVTVLGKLFAPIVPLFTKQQNW